MNAEQQRLKDLAWKKWGPYVSDRQWGTIREDYSADGDAWRYTTHDMARSKAWRWGEEGIAGICDDQQILCFALSLWNTKDPFLKERYFGLSNPEGNHGEDVKELYYYLDNTPAHSYMKMLYKYPQQEFPYKWLTEENGKRNRDQPEFELIDTGIFEENKYFDVFVEYAKQSPEDILVNITIHNRAQETASLFVLPTLWFRNSWSWGHDDYVPAMRVESHNIVSVYHKDLGQWWLHCDGTPQLLFCDNETNTGRLYTVESSYNFYKDGINDHIVHGNETVNPEGRGTKTSASYELHIPAEQSVVIRLRLSKDANASFDDFDDILFVRKQEADDFYKDLQVGGGCNDALNVQRQAFAGMLWNKQFYHYDLYQWLKGDPAQPAPPDERLKGRNYTWKHLNNKDILSMPDKWEFPWFAAWDMAFHCLPLAMLDIDFAKNQLLLLTKEWYMHPNGHLPAYEWNFGDANPPIHALACWIVYKMERNNNNGKGDIIFLEKVFHKLMLNFTWWVNRKDITDSNIFEGGFLGLDNIGVFDRNAVLPDGGKLEQADASSWMAMYSLNLLRIAAELAIDNEAYADIAAKFFEHFMYIAGAMTGMGENKENLWDENDNFYYDFIRLPNDGSIPLKVRSIVGFIPFFAVEIMDDMDLAQQPAFVERIRWFSRSRPDLACLVSRWGEKNSRGKHLVSLLRGYRMKMLLKRMLDENEFLSEYGIRSLSKYHLNNPYQFTVQGETLSVKYLPAESDSNLFGGNSNWRGPIWMPINYLIIESLYRFHRYYGDDFKVEFPTGSGVYLSLKEVANELSRRVSKIFLQDGNGNRPVFGKNAKMQQDAHFNNYVLFHEYFDGDTGRGLGASHQTGWTGLIVNYLLKAGL
ncbi:MAG: glucosidase [Chitinophagaceae bacterium]